MLNTLLKGIQRVHGSQPSRKLPITVDILCGIKCRLNLNCPNDIVFWAACMVAFYGLLRKSNLLPCSQRAFSADKHLCSGDLFKAPHGLALRIKWSKTVQFKERSYFIPMPYLAAHPLCPATALARLRLQHAHASSDAPLLVQPNGTPPYPASFLG